MVYELHVKKKFIRATYISRALVLCTALWFRFGSGYNT